MNCPKCQRPISKFSKELCFRCRRIWASSKCSGCHAPMNGFSKSGLCLRCRRVCPTCSGVKDYKSSECNPCKAKVHPYSCRNGHGRTDDIVVMRNGRGNPPARRCRRCFRAKTSAWNEANPEKVRASVRAWTARNRAKAAAYHHRWATHKDSDNPTNDLTRLQWQLLLKIFGGHCAYCWELTEKLTQDHIVPLSRGGAHTLTNVVPACRSCNSSKGPNIWRPRLKFGTFEYLNQPRRAA
jgi:5-methylcytosine-specific restriction endonuclease McrA